MQSDAYRPPRKSPSFLSLRRETATRAVSSNTSPSSYFDFYPKKSKVTRSRQDSPPTPKGPEVNPTYAFPTFDPIDVLSSAHPSIVRKQYVRTRTRTGPEAKPQWDDVPQLRFSGSSSTQYTETPPRTPVDSMTSNMFSDHFPVVVAAPVAGVETMDALVDGMNGGDITSRMPSRARFGIPGHHPLYQPPLPTPPPGVVLGGGKPRSQRRSPPSTASGESSDDEDSCRSLPNPSSRVRRRVRRPGSSRTPSNSTIIPHHNSQNSGDETTSQSHVVRPSLSRPVENRKIVVPSISEIIRNHATPECQVRSRPPTIRSSSLYSPSTQGHATLHEEVESESEPREEEAGFVSRSSMDTVADEVQRTIRNQNFRRPAPAPTPAPLTSAIMRRQSIFSDNTSLYSPRSDPGTGSIYSVSAPSSYISNSPFDTANYFNMVKPTPSQAVAQYLRSPRLTTLLKLTRSPHASQDNPLTVSLSDLGCPTGFPVVVFLGLGCVRHIMGLYDEMADCMGLRLITIDR